MRLLGKRSKRTDVFSVPDHHRDRERVFLVPQHCQAAIRERLHEFIHKVSKGIIEAYLDIAHAERYQASVNLSPAPAPPHLGRVRYLMHVKVKTREGKEREVSQLVDLTPTVFSTLIEKYVWPVTIGGKGEVVHKSISLEVAVRTLVCPAFMEELPLIGLFTEVRLPIRCGKAIALSKPGYDPDTGVYTCLDAPEVDESLSVQEAAKEWESLLKEFCFPNDEDQKKRAVSVALAAALTPFCLYLLNERANRPAFCVSANAEGAGKTLLLSIGMVAKLGYVPTGAVPIDDEEMRKVLDSAVHFAAPILFFDNVKGYLSSGELEAFITSFKRRYRVLGTTNYTEADIVSTVYLTANFATFSTDLWRRLLAIELFLEQAKAEEREMQN
jgi:hypothetical protein